MAWIAFLLMLDGGCIPVAGDRILAVDLAPFVEAFRGVDGRRFVGYAPMPGLERRLTRRELEAAAGTANGNAQLPDSICVVRVTAKLAAADAAEAIRQSLPPDAKLDILRVPDWPVPAGRLEFPLHGLRATGEGGLYHWRGRLVPHAGGRSWPVPVTVRIRLVRPVLVAGRDVEPGAELSEADLKTEKREVAVPPPGAAPEPGFFVGWTARRRLEAGKPVSTYALQPPPAAKAGQRVVLTAEAGAARVTMEAKALTGGRVGDRLLLKSPLSGGRVRARLTGAGQAVVDSDAWGERR